MVLETTLRDHSLFVGQPRRALRHAGRLMTQVQVPAGRTLMRTGEIGREFLVILDGAVVVSDDDGVIGELGSDDFVGELALLGRTRRCATVVTLAPTEVLALNRFEFAMLLDRLPTVGMRIAQTGVQRAQARFHHN